MATLRKLSMLTGGYSRQYSSHLQKEVADMLLSATWFVTAGKNDSFISANSARVYARSADYVPGGARR